MNVRRYFFWYPYRGHLNINTHEGLEKACEEARVRIRASDLDPNNLIYIGSLPVNDRGYLTSTSQEEWTKVAGVA